MGQRLVVDLLKDDEVVAAIYYHWSAYFGSTIKELTKLSKAILEAEKTSKDKLLTVVEMLEEEEEFPNYFNNTIEKRRGGISGYQGELEAAQKLYPDHEFKTENVDRNRGLIAFTEEGIKSFHDWEEGHAEIDLDTHEITNGVDLDPDPFEFVDAEYTTDEYGDEYIETLYSGRIKINDITCNIDPFECTCETIIELNDFMNTQYEIYRENLKL